MEFCPKCGAILIQKRKNYGCPRCGYVSKEKAKIVSSEKMKSNPELGVVSEKDSQILPVVEVTCKKCGHGKAYFWTMQTRASDESETKFYKCTKCGITWRDYK